MSLLVNSVAALTRRNGESRSPGFMSSSLSVLLRFFWGLWRRVFVSRLLRAFDKSSRMVSSPPPREPASFVAMTLVLQSMTEYGVDDAGLDYRLIMMLAIILGFVFGCLFFRVWPRTYASAAWRHKKYGCGGLLARSLIYLSLQTRLVTRRKRHDVCVERASVSMPQQSIRPAGYYS